ncbi:MAG TPA: hypothetical protein VMS17_30420 [Gemmataceae bacterium]|nr:hypothetical protein [Gemmataceae bacterium]
MAKHAHSPELRRALLEVVENQLREGAPPEIRTTLERLLSEGVSRDRALELIACVVSSVIFDVLKNGQTYREARYLAGLRALPRLPWEGDAEPEAAPDRGGI